MQTPDERTSLPAGRHPGAITGLLQRVAGGDESAREPLARALYGELHRMARRHMARQPGDHTLQATALVNEVWLRVEGAPGGCRDRAHYLAVAAAAMRQILIDHARSRGRQKRGGGARRVPLDDLVDAYERQSGDLGRFDEALERMKAFAPEMARAVELRFFGGAEVEECARILGMSKRTFERRWATTAAWLSAELRED